MIDLHMHTVFSDGELIPAELARRAEVLGCRAIAVTDHVDLSNVEHVVESIVRFCNEDRRAIRVLPGAEVTHVSPSQIADVVKRARKAGAKVVLVHGETLMEPVERGTNEAAIDAGVDILAHPGMITVATAKKAAAAGVRLEISGRGGHGFSNGHVARMALEAGAKLVFNTDTHAPRDLLDREAALRTIMAAGLAREQALETMQNSQQLVEALSGKV